MRCLKTLAGCIAAVTAFANASADEYNIELLSADKNDVVQIGTLKTSSNGESERYKMTLNPLVFEDQFLSMRPFKCVRGEEKLWCHSPYPYEIAREITTTDWTDLEYDLIFVWKPQGDYGINLWNGVYYKLEPTENGWSGIMHEYDLGVLGIPPEDGELRPIDPVDLHGISIEDHLYPYIEIRSN